MLHTHETRCKYQLKQITKKTREKNAATNENCILRQIGLKFQNPSFNILCKGAFWNKQNYMSQNYLEQPVQVKRQSVWWDRLEK